MPIETLLINGPTGGGKSTVARLMADEVLQRQAHYLRMRAAADGHTNVVLAYDGPPAGSPIGNGWLSMHNVTYTADRVFETLPEGLRAVRRRDRSAFLILEADSDPAIRHAYPYDYRVFVMAVPGDLHTVFRTPRAAAKALQQVMQDTAAFASEIFGLFDAAGLDDSVGVVHRRSTMPRDLNEELEQLDIEESQLRQFLNSPLGAEIASRIQLQPDYHALVEADVVVINAGLGEPGDEMDECVSRIEKLLARIRHDARRHSVLYWGDVTDKADPTYHKLLARFRSLFTL